MHSLGYRISTPDGRRLTVATDLGYISDPVRERLTGSDLVLIESNYDQRMLSVSDYPYQLKKRTRIHRAHKLFAGASCIDQQGGIRSADIGAVAV